MSLGKHTLPNGLRILSEEVTSVRSVAVGIWVKAGSRYETLQQHGITHFLEHLMFKGTPTRSARDIAEQMDAVGGQLNAFTAKEYTCFYARVLSDHLPFAMELLSDMILRSTLDEPELNREKSVVLEEIKLYEDTPDDLIHDLCAQAVLGGHPLGRPVLGTVDSISGLQRPDVVDYRNYHYTPDNIIVSVAGEARHDQVVSEVEKHFGSLTGRSLLQETAGLETGRDLFKDKETEQIHLCLGARGYTRHSDRRFGMQVLDTLLGGSVSSRLFQELREERGLVYSTFSSHASYQDTGLFSVYVGVSRDNLSHVLSIIRREIDSLRAGEISENEVLRAKEQLRGNILFGLESTSSRMSRLAKSEMFYGEILSPDAMIERIQAVTTAEVADIAREVFTASPHLAAIGSLGGLEPLWAAFRKGW